MSLGMVLIRFRYRFRVASFLTFRTSMGNRASSLRDMSMMAPSFLRPPESVALALGPGSVCWLDEEAPGLEVSAMVAVEGDSVGESGSGSSGPSGVATWGAGEVEVEGTPSDSDAEGVGDDGEASRSDPRLGAVTGSTELARPCARGGVARRRGLGG